MLLSIMIAIGYITYAASQPPGCGVPNSTLTAVYPDAYTTFYQYTNDWVSVGSRAHLTMIPCGQQKSFDFRLEACSWRDEDGVFDVYDVSYLTEECKSSNWDCYWLMGDGYYCATKGDGTHITSGALTWRAAGGGAWPAAQRVDGHEYYVEW